MNINVMLSAPEDYQGGALRVGNVQVPARRGDLYWYVVSRASPAAATHPRSGTQQRIRIESTTYLQACDIPLS